MATEFRLAQRLIAVALITGGLQVYALAQSESADDAAADGADAAGKPQSPDEAMEFLMRAVRRGSDADFDALLPDTFVEAFQKGRTAARAKTEACERLAQAMQGRSFGKEGEDLANAILQPSHFDACKEWKTMKVTERKPRSDGRVLLVVYVEWKPPAAEPEAKPQFAYTQFLSEKAGDGWRLLPVAVEPNEKQLEKLPATMKTAKEATEHTTAQINKLADNVTAGKFKDARQVKNALLKIGALPHGKPVRSQGPRR
ncbi:MAG TPA: hypothetical protein VG826_02165 [Pirellulales bacterium]|nr:hypothetical protein [Pirellulales bacterium]